MNAMPRRILLPVTALVLLALGLVLLGQALTPAAYAQETGGPRGNPDIRFGQDVVVPQGQVREVVVVFGGDVRVAGTVTTSVVAFGGDVRLLPTADVGRQLAEGDPAVVSFGGTVVRSPGATVHGDVQTFEGGDWGGAADALARGADASRWFGMSFDGWLIQAAIFLVFGLVAAAFMPRQLLAVQRALAARPGASFGWGALAVFIGVPVLVVVLAVSLVGIPLLLPLGVGVALVTAFVITAVAAMVAQRLLRGANQQFGLMATVAMGVVATTIVTRIPVLGALLLLAMLLAGTGAAVLAVVEWRRGRRPAAQPGAPAETPGSPAGPDPFVGQAATAAGPLTAEPGTAVLPPATVAPPAVVLPVARPLDAAPGRGVPPAPPHRPAAVLGPLTPHVVPPAPRDDQQATGSGRPAEGEHES
jgi:hypothetical protein